MHSAGPVGLVMGVWEKSPVARLWRFSRQFYVYPVSEAGLLCVLSI